MDMSTIENALKFWVVVEECLVELFGFERELAHSRVVQVQGKLTEAAIRQDVSYHFEPLHIASNIAHVDIIPPATEEAYTRLLLASEFRQYASA